jgi:hypothetical protein
MITGTPSGTSESVLTPSHASIRAVLALDLALLSPAFTVSIATLSSSLRHVPQPTHWRLSGFHEASALGME